MARHRPRSWLLAALLLQPLACSEAQDGASACARVPDLGLPPGAPADVLVASTRHACLAAGLTGPFASVQAAIDAAPAGALVVVDAEIWPESLRISKDLTLVGVVESSAAGPGGGGAGRAALHPPDGQPGVVITGGAMAVLARLDVRDATGAGIRVASAKAVLAAVSVRDTRALAEGGGGHGVEAIGAPSAASHLLIAAQSEVVGSAGVGLVVDRSSLQLADAAVRQNGGGGVAIVRSAPPTQADLIVDPYIIGHLEQVGALAAGGAEVFAGPAAIVDPYIAGDPQAIVDPYITASPCSAPPPIDPVDLEAAVIVRTALRSNRAFGLGLWGSAAFVDDSEIALTETKAAVAEALGGGPTVVEAFGDGVVVRSYDGRPAGLVAGRSAVLERNGRAGILIDTESATPAATAVVRGVARQSAQGGAWAQGAGSRVYLCPDAALEDNDGFGLIGIEGAALRADGGVIRGTRARALRDVELVPVTFGDGVHIASGASFVASGTEIADGAVAGLVATAPASDAFELSGVTIAGSPYGVVIQDAATLPAWAHDPADELNQISTTSDHTGVELDLGLPVAGRACEASGGGCPSAAAPQ